MKRFLNRSKNQPQWQEAIGSMMQVVIPIFIMLMFAAIGCKNKPTEAVELKASAPVSSCPCSSNWFPHKQTPAPLEGVGSPFDTNNTTVCMFHQWSWQKFLWLTKPVASGRPLFVDSLTQVDNHMTPVAPINGISLVLEDSTQAGSAGILQSNPSYGDGQAYTVFYSIHSNPTMIQAADSIGTLIAQNPTLANNKFVFPVGSLELKVSWINANAIAPSDLNKYFIMDAIVMPGNKKIKAALLGMHVVGVVINHPEFIWATFEHQDMAPKYDWKSTTTQDVPVTSATDLLFFAKGATATYQNLTYSGSESPANIFAVYKYGIPVIAQDSFMPTAQSEPTNKENIEGLNACANAGLNGDVWQNYFYNGSIWLNMDGLTQDQQVDTILALGNNIGNAVLGARARGCLGAFNITMETFAQDFNNVPMTQMNNTSLTNCFSCHTSPANLNISGKSYKGNSPMYLSHIFRGHLSVSTGVPVSKVESIRTKEFIEVVKNRQSFYKKQ